MILIENFQSASNSEYEEKNKNVEIDKWRWIEEDYTLTPNDADEWWQYNAENLDATYYFGTLPNRFCKEDAKQLHIDKLESYANGYCWEPIVPLI